MTTNTITLSLFEFGQPTIPTSNRKDCTGTGGIEVYKLPDTKTELSVDDMFAQLSLSGPRAPAALEAGTKWVAQTFFPEHKNSLATLRMAAGLTQRELGNRLNVSQPMIAKWEKGEAPNMQLKTVVSLATALSIDLHELINVLVVTGEGTAYEH